jgi:YtoQ family protein
MSFTVYLSGEIHTDWREVIQASSEAKALPVQFTGPVTDHGASDDCGVAILGAEPQKLWHDRKGAGINAIRTRTLIEQADIVVVRFGTQYKQWNAAFDAVEIPGERERRLERERRKLGIPTPPASLQAMRRAASELEVDAGALG